MKLTNLCLVGVVALALAAAPVARAQDNTMSTPVVVTDQNVTGVVVSTAGDQVVITTDAGTRMVFDRDATLVLPTVSVGDRVTVTYRTVEPDHFAANRVVLVTVPSTTTTTTTTTTTDNTATTTENTYSSSSTDNDNLPATAGPLPLVGLLGSLSVGAGVALRHLTSRRK